MKPNKPKPTTVKLDKTLKAGLKASNWLKNSAKPKAKK